jgi:hydrogenase nickel incorporation protein HypA/HybF
MCEAIARKVADRAAGRTVTRVVVRIGHLRQVVPEAMTFSWEMLVTGSVLDGADLEIEHVPVTVWCAACETVTALDVPVLVCGSCGSGNTEVRSGDELILVSFDTTGQPAEAR